MRRKSRRATKRHNSGTMKHRRSVPKLRRLSAARRALLRNLTSQVLQYGAVITTRAKAKALVTHLDPLIVRGQRELTLQRRRYLLAALSTKRDLPRLLTAARAAQSRRSGFLRITRLAARKGDAAALARVEIIER